MAALSGVYQKCGIRLCSTEISYIYLHAAISGFTWNPNRSDKDPKKFLIFSSLKLKLAFSQILVIKTALIQGPTIDPCSIVGRL